MTKKKGLIISRQTGSARAFEAWLKEPATRENFDLDVWYYPECENILAGTKITSFTKPEKKYDFIFSGTSLEAADDSLFYKWARETRTPSIAFIDQWVNYSERFIPEHMPDHIFVVDNKALGEAQHNLGVQSDIKAAGTPALHYISSFWKTHTPKKNKNILYFNTEPASPAYQKKNGIDDLQQLDYLIEFMKHRPEWTLHIRPHPLDQLNHFARLEKYKSFLVNESKEESFEKATLMAGMRSFILLEASLISIPVLSLQIGRKTTSGLTDSRPNITVVTEKENINLNLKTEAPDLNLCQNTWSQSILEILA